MPCLLFFTRIKINCAALARKQIELYHLGSGSSISLASGYIQVTAASSDFICKEAPGVQTTEPGEASGKHDQTPPTHQKGDSLERA